MVMPSQSPRELGVVVVENPTHFTLRELLVRRYGLERADQMQPFRSLWEAGLPVAIGSDGPNNPYLNIMLASVYPGAAVDLRFGVPSRTHELVRSHSGGGRDTLCLRLIPRLCCAVPQVELLI
jgi:hypothetical protein